MPSESTTPEFDSIESFVQELLDDGRTTYRPVEMQQLARRLRQPDEAFDDCLKRVAAELAEWGVTPVDTNRARRGMGDPGT